MLHIPTKFHELWPGSIFLRTDRGNADSCICASTMWRLLVGHVFCKPSMEEMWALGSILFMMIESYERDKTWRMDQLEAFRVLDFISAFSTGHLKFIFTIISAISLSSRSVSPHRANASPVLLLWVWAWMCLCEDNQTLLFSGDVTGRLTCSVSNNISNTHTSALLLDACSGTHTTRLLYYSTLKDHTTLL